MRPADLPSSGYACGTNAGYKSGCKCVACLAKHAEYARDRVKRIHAAAAEVVPNGPPLPGTLVRAGKVYQVKMCPGTGGKPCVRKAWLRGAAGGVCLACVERAKVWNGAVSTERAREHIIALSKKGVGRRAVAEASGVSAVTIHEIRLNRKKYIRTDTERRILAVDEGARADRSLVRAWPMRMRLKQLRGRGFTWAWISRELGYKAHTGAWLLLHPQNNGRRVVTARSVADVEKLYQRVLREKLKPAPFNGWVDAAPVRKLLLALIEDGFTRDELRDRLGFNVAEVLRDRRPKMRQKNAEAVAALHREVSAEADEDLGPQRISPAEARRLVEAHRDGVEMADLVERFGRTPWQLKQIIDWAAEPGAVIG